METKKVTLSNGTVLDVGNTYEFDKFERGDYFTIMFIGDYLMHYKYNASGDEISVRITKDLMILPYKPQTQQKEWKTFLIERGQRANNGRVIVQFQSIEDAKSHYPHAASITEIKLNIEPVNS